MRTWGYKAPAEMLSRVANAAVQFRGRWNATPNRPWPCEFDGTIVDVQTLDYMEHERIPFPEQGDENAALLCGEVFRRAAQLEWWISYRGDWWLTMPEGEWPGLAICPLTRLQEIHFAQTPQFGHYECFIDRAVVESIQSRGIELDIARLLSKEGNHIAGLRRTLAALDESTTRQ